MSHSYWKTESREQRNRRIPTEMGGTTKTWDEHGGASMTNARSVGLICRRDQIKDPCFFQWWLNSLCNMEERWVWPSAFSTSHWSMTDRPWSAVIDGILVVVSILLPMKLALRSEKLEVVPSVSFMMKTSTGSALNPPQTVDAFDFDSHIRPGSPIGQY